MHFLIPYVHSIPPDPVFDEYTYGDSGQRARKLKLEVSKGDYLFFHTSKGGTKYITAYYMVEERLDTVKAAQDLTIRKKYNNHHIHDFLKGIRPESGEDDVIVFGNPVFSNILQTPLPFDKQLASKLSLNIQFPQHRSEAQAIVSATRAWRQLTDEVKLHKIGRDALRQIKNYIRELSQQNPGKNVTGVLICSGVMPAFDEELRRQSEVKY